MRFTANTRRILDYITEYKFITAKQCANIFYKNRKLPLIMAQKKLKLLYDNGVIKRVQDKYTKEYVYSYDGNVPNNHKLYIMNLYSYLFNRYDIVYFKLEETWNVSKRRNDAHIIIEKDGCLIGILAEIDINHKTNRAKTQSIYESGEVQHWYEVNFGDSYFPSFVIVNANGKTNIESNHYEVIATDFNLSNLSELL